LPSDAARIRQILAKKPSNVVHLGKLPFTDIQALLQAAAAFIMPNIQVPGDMEGFGLVCLEACMCGAPVFAADIDGIPAAIQHGKNGRLLPSGNAAAWVSALHDFLQHKKEPNEIIRASAYTKDHFSWDKMVKAYYSVFITLQKVG
jgi:L-malate glycosyltransferase